MKAIIGTQDIGYTKCAIHEGDIIYREQIEYLGEYIKQIKVNKWWTWYTKKYRMLGSWNMWDRICREEVYN